MRPSMATGSTAWCCMRPYGATERATSIPRWPQAWPRRMPRTRVRARWCGRRWPRTRFQSGVPAGRRDELMPADWFAAWSAADLARRPVGATNDPPVLLVPPGVAEDSEIYWNFGKPYYDPKKITAPTLVVAAEWDAVTPADQARALHDALVNSPGKRFVELKEGSHIMMLE